MPRFDVHIYAIARLEVAGVEAESPHDAAQEAEHLVDLRQAIARAEAEYAEEIEGFLVDCLDDAEERIEGQSILFDLTEERTN